MGFRAWIRERKGKVATVRTAEGAYESGGAWEEETYRGALGALRDNHLYVGRRDAVPVSYILWVSVGHGELRCILDGTDEAVAEYDDWEGWGPLEHEGEKCAIHDEAPWRLWDYQLKTRHKQGDITTYKVDLLDFKKCSCGKNATAYVDRFRTRGVFLERIAMCESCGMKANPTEGIDSTPRSGSLYHYQRKCQGCGAWLPVEPNRWKEQDTDGDIVYEFLWICVSCGKGWGSEGTAKPSEYTWLGPAKSNLYAGPRLVESFGDEPEETLDPQEPGSFDPGPAKDPAKWKNANALTVDQANLVRAAWDYLDAIRGSDWLADVHLVWNLENALIDQDIREVIRATRVYLTEAGEGTVSSNESEVWEPALRGLKQAAKQAIRKRRPAEEARQSVSARVNRLLEWLMTWPVHSHVIVHLVASNYYVQFALGEDSTLIAEAVSNTFLGPEEQLSHRRVKRLLELGWDPPEVDSAQRADLENKFANFYHVWKHPVPIGEAVNLAVQTAFEVYGAKEYWEFEYETWMHEHDDADK